MEIYQHISWSQLEEKQRFSAQRIRDGAEKGVFIVSEPTPTFTYGRFSPANDCLWNEAELKKRGIEVAAVTRGGKWTYHGPGQVVLFPVLSMKALGFHRHASQLFLLHFRKLAFDYLNSIGVQTEVGSKPFGIYVNGKKLVSFGISIENGISQYGLALYLKSQQIPFKGIHPCGVIEGEVTSLEELGYDFDWPKIAKGLGLFVKKGFQESQNALAFPFTRPLRRSYDGNESTPHE